MVLDHIVKLSICFSRKLNKFGNKEGTVGLLMILANTTPAFFFLVNIKCATSNFSNLGQGQHYGQFMMGTAQGKSAYSGKNKNYR